jgi:hypothetical protein
MSFRDHCRVSTKHLQQSRYETPEAALDAGISLRADGASGVYIIDPADHVFTLTRFSTRIGRKY